MGIMAEAGRYYPALRRQFIDATDNTAAHPYTDIELQRLAQAAEDGPLVEHSPTRIQALQRMAEVATIDTAALPTTPQETIGG